MSPILRGSIKSGLFLSALLYVGFSVAKAESLINLINVNSKKCVDDLGYARTAGGLQGFWACNGGENQKLRILLGTDGRTTLVNSFSQLCLDVPYASNKSGVKIQQYSCNGTAAQKFTFLKTGANNYKITTLNSRLCLDGSRADGILQQLKCNGSTAQLFSAQDVVDPSAVPLPSVAAALPPPPPTPAPTPAPARFPANTSPTGAGFNKGIAAGLYNYSAAELPAVIGDLQAMGVAWVRMDFPWSEMQPTGPDSYNLEAWDRSTKALTDAGIHVLGIIDYTPAWARAPGTNKFYPPTKAGDFGKFAAYLANRYAPLGVHSWEIWNEENGATFWQPAPDAAGYVALLRAAYPAIKSADPTAIVILGGMATFGDDGINQNARTFLTGVYVNGGKALFDAVGFHPYTYPELPSTSIWNNWGQMADATPSLRSIMTDNGDSSKQIWLTELGFPTMPSDSRLTESQQADYLKQAYTLQANFNWAGPLFWYTYQDNRTVQNPNYAEDWFGLVRPDGSQKPAYQVFKDLPR